MASLPSPMKKLGLRKNIKKIFLPKDRDDEEYYDSDNGEYLNEREYELGEGIERVV